MPHAACRNINGLSAMVQMKRELFLGITLVEPKPNPKIKNRYECKGRRLQFKIHVIAVSVVTTHFTCTTNAHSSHS